VTARQQSRLEFSRPLPLERLSHGPIEIEVSADARERAALARRFDLLALDRLSAVLRVSRAKGLIRVDGHLDADVTQTCVVSLEPVQSEQHEDFVQLYTLDPAAAGSHEVAVEPGEEETPEPLGPEGLDLGEAVAQQLALALDPYPRAPGASPPEDLAEPETEAPAKGPFEALRALKPRS
jgi:uncharacterized metal-binding protein YceD (DUF177 family)